MESLAALRQPHTDQQPRLQLLLADDDARMRSLVAAQACDLVDALIVLEAADGGEAIQVALQRTPQLALLDVNMPRLGGIEVAMTLRELRPEIRLALHAADPLTHRERARRCRLPLFDKLERERVFGWLELQARSLAEPFAEPFALQRQRTLACSACGYGIARALPPGRCPMCQREDTWIDSPCRPFAVDRGFA
jgi:CheY-like chemotaxis protein